MLTRQSSLQDGRELRVGDYVEVRPIAEILATLDAQGSLDALPFMPEMVPHCGCRYRVVKSAHKTCDPTGSSNLRWVSDAVHLETRCDGSAHGGCQAGCLFFWRSDWLKRVAGPLPQSAVAPSSPKADPPTLVCDLEGLQRATRASSTVPGEIRYRCQATELVRFSTAVSSIEPTQYIRDLVSGNVPFKDFVLYSLLAILTATKRMLISPEVWRAAKRFLRRLRGKAPKAGAGNPSEGAATQKLNLQPSELVRVRPADEIRSTLDDDGKNRGLSFDPDMAQRAGGVFRVSKRVELIIDEKTGKLLRIRKDCIILEGVSCIGTRKCNRLFCPRGALQFWRESWLERFEAGRGARVETPQGAIDKKSEYV